MRRPQGYAVLSDPGSDVPFDQWDTFTCNHCQHIVHVKPRCDPADLGGMCSHCRKLICKHCHDRRVKGADCVPWEETMERMTARIDALRSYGL